MNAEQEIERTPVAAGANSSAQSTTSKTRLLLAVAVAAVAVLLAVAMLRPGDDTKSGAQSTASVSPTNASGLIRLGSATEHPLAPALVLAAKVKKNIED